MIFAMLFAFLCGVTTLTVFLDLAEKRISEWTLLMSVVTCLLAFGSITIYVSY